LISRKYQGKSFFIFNQVTVNLHFLIFLQMQVMLFMVHD